MPASRVLVTGGGTGIGLAVAQALLARGGQVTVVGRRPEPLAALAQAHPGRAFALPGDLTDPAFRASCLAAGARLMGGLDGLVHSAGVVTHEPPGHLSEAALRAQLELNLVAPLRLGEAALEALPTGGAVVFITSTLARRPVLTSAAYSAAKAGLGAAMASLALAGAPRGVRFNAVAPGLVDTELIAPLRLAPGEVAPTGAALEARLAAQRAQLAALQPVGRLGTPAEVARVVLTALDTEFMTGAELVVDGGLLLRE